MYICNCTQEHSGTRIVLTGGPGAGKTAVLELARQYFCKHVLVLPEAAGILYGGGFPRTHDPRDRAAAQRAIFHVQRELEQIGEERDQLAVVLCDRGTIDGVAYWPGPRSLWDELGVDPARELARYHMHGLHQAIRPAAVTAQSRRTINRRRAGAVLARSRRKLPLLAPVYGSGA